MEQGNIIFRADGEVIKGDKKGSELGFPTANIPCEDGVPSGIFAGEVVWDGASHPAAIYKSGSKNIVEAHLLDFSGNLYGETIVVNAKHKIRDDKNFDDDKKLAAAITKDMEEIKRLCLPE
jgi:FAD synthase